MEVEKNRFIVRYKNDMYDLSKFLLKHPGGVNTLIGLKNSDLTNRFMNTPPHSNAAKYLLKEYRLENSASIKEDQKIKDISNEANNNYKNFPGLTDDSMEIIIIILLTTPIVSPEQWIRLFRHPVANLIVHQIHTYLYIYMSLLLLLWFNSMRDMRLYSKAHPCLGSPCKIEESIALMEQKINFYQAERNFFISGFAIVGTMLMSQLFKLFTQPNLMGDVSSHVISEGGIT